VEKDVEQTNVGEEGGGMGGGPGWQGPGASREKTPKWGKGARKNLFKKDLLQKKQGGVARGTKISTTKKYGKKSGGGEKKGVNP